MVREGLARLQAAKYRSGQQRLPSRQFAGLGRAAEFAGIIKGEHAALRQHAE